MAERTRSVDKVQAAMLLAGAALIVAYWLAYFLTDLTKPDFTHNLTDPRLVRLTAVYLGFEGAFPLPDGFVAICLALAGVNLLANKPRAVLFGLVGGGGLMFLALIDIFFNVTQGLYAPAMLAADFGMKLEVVINVACLAGAAWAIWRLWGHPLRLAPA